MKNVAVARYSTYVLGLLFCCAAVFAQSSPKRTPNSTGDTPAVISRQGEALGQLQQRIAQVPEQRGEFVHAQQLQGYKNKVVKKGKQ